MAEVSPSPPAYDPLLEQLRTATLGTYEIYGELGRGGMATVYLAHEIALDRKVAIKVMSPALVHGPGMSERFKREARTAANLSHPNIIPVYSVREAEGLLFFVMKLVEGTPLDAIMREVGKLPLPMVEAILAQIGGAFGYAHRHGVVHRDIKPSNILIDDEGWAVVTDFGIAKVKESEGLTQSGVAVGTPTYMSPEQCSGGAIGGASDQYSLGIVAYEMLAGRPPFTGPSMMPLMYSHFHEPPPPIEEFRLDCPERIRDAIYRMLAKEPAQRFASMEDAVVALGGRQLAHDDPTRSQLISLARTGVISKIVSQVQTPRSPVPMGTRERVPAALPTPAPEPARPSRRPRLAVGALLAIGVVAVALWRWRADPAGVLVAPRESASVSAAPPVAIAPAPRPDSPGNDQGTVQPPAARGTSSPAAPRPPAAAAAAKPAVTDSRAGLPGAGRNAPAVDSGPSRVAVAPPVPAPAPTPPPAPAPSPPAEPAAPPPRVVDDKADVTAAILAYARALDAGDLAQARRLYPGMTAEQRQDLEAFWKAAGTMRTRWAVSDVSVDGDVATARVQGSSVVTVGRERSSEQRVNLRARLERRGAEWRLLALVN